MRNLIFLATCLSLIAVAWGNLYVGWHRPGEILVGNQVTIVPPVIAKPNTATCTGTAPSGYEISLIIVTTPTPWKVRLSVSEGGLHSDYAVVSAIGRPSMGYVIRCVILAAPSKSTTPKPTTEKSTTQKSTTEKSTTQKSTTEKSTTQKSTTQKSTTQKSTTQKTTSTTENELTTVTDRTTTETTAPPITNGPTTDLTPPLCTSTPSPTEEPYRIIDDVE